MITIDFAARSRSDLQTSIRLLRLCQLGKGKKKQKWNKKNMKKEKRTNLCSRCQRSHDEPQDAMHDQVGQSAVELQHPQAALLGRDKKDQATFHWIGSPCHLKHKMRDHHWIRRKIAMISDRHTIEQFNLPILIDDRISVLRSLSRIFNNTVTARRDHYHLCRAKYHWKKARREKWKGQSVHREILNAYPFRGPFWQTSLDLAQRVWLTCWYRGHGPMEKVKCAKDRNRKTAKRSLEKK